MGIFYINCSVDYLPFVSLKNKNIVISSGHAAFSDQIICGFRFSLHVEANPSELVNGSILDFWFFRYPVHPNWNLPSITIFDE